MGRKWPLHAADVNEFQRNSFKVYRKLVSHTILNFKKNPDTEYDNRVFLRLKVKFRIA
jgi:hypothetical protein